MTSYKSISSENTAELIIKKSKFISLLKKASTKEEVERVLESLKKEYAGTNHIIIELTYVKTILKETK